eukprot:2153254-Rhodomonas_salina.2
MAYASLEPHRKSFSQASVEDDKDGTTAGSKFLFQFGDTSGAEKGSLGEKLGLPGADVDQAMFQEHQSGEVWTTGNYGLQTSAEQEWEFVNDPKADKVYPGEEKTHKSPRRRQHPLDAWTTTKNKLPVAEALKSFKSELEIDRTRLVQVVSSIIKACNSEQAWNEMLWFWMLRAI